MKDKVIIHESVRSLIEFILRSGSLDNRFISIGRARQGTIAHKKLQRSNEELYENYQKEVSLEFYHEFENCILKVQGRADSIIFENSKVIIEEIKSTTKPVILIEEVISELHLAQGIIYGFIYANQNNLKTIIVRVSYINILNDEVKSFDREFEFDELYNYVHDILNKYSKWVELRFKLLNERNESIQKLSFPFENYRKGQREFALTCYNVIKQNKVLFAQAPTGTGKTIATLFPALKAMVINDSKRITYLTAKTTTASVVEKCISLLHHKGLKCKFISLTSKEKMCLNDKVECNPDSCEYAKDYFTKINDIVWRVLSEEDEISRGIINKYSKEYKICPFELSLELSNWTDIIICDYNYAFDPWARLSRIFDEDIDSNILLIDEGHNLVDRVRSSYSEELSKSEFNECRKKVKGKSKSLDKIITQIIKYYNELLIEVDSTLNDYIVTDVEESNFKQLLYMFIKEVDDFLQRYKDESSLLIELYFKCRKYLSVSEYFNENYRVLIRRFNRDISVKILCINPKENIKYITEKSGGTIIFSATFTPFEYYIKLMGGSINSYRFKLESPFDKENITVSCEDINLRYSYRDKNIEEVCRLIHNFINDKKGNYMVFFPSYEYMDKVYDYYINAYDDNIMKQNQSYTEEEKNIFINQYTEDSIITSFCVIGGIFSEGIDLPGKRLIGAIIVGVGMPKISLESNIIKDFFGEEGFDYAYIYPGINKVLQAAGRVIRTENDKGNILLIDDRYRTKKYRKLLPNEWGVK